MLRLLNSRIFQWNAMIADANMWEIQCFSAYVLGNATLRQPPFADTLQIPSIFQVIKAGDIPEWQSSMERSPF